MPKLLFVSIEGAGAKDIVPYIKIRLHERSALPLGTMIDTHAGPNSHHGGHTRCGVWEVETGVSAQSNELVRRGRNNKPTRSATVLRQ